MRVSAKCLNVNVYHHGCTVLTCFVALCHFWFPRPMYSQGHKMPFFTSVLKGTPVTRFKALGSDVDGSFMAFGNEDAHLNRHFVYMTNSVYPQIPWPERGHLVKRVNGHHFGSVSFMCVFAQSVVGQEWGSV